MEWKTIALLATLGLALVLLGTSAPAASAQDGGSLIIGVSTCPEGYDGEDYAADCTTPASGIDFAIGTPNTDNVEITTSRGDGLVTFSLAPYDLNPEAPDPVNVGEAVQGIDYAVFCTKNDGEALDFAYETIDFEPGGPLLGISFEIEPTDEIACEWYNIPPASGDDDGSNDDVSRLPNTGIGTGASSDTGRFDGLPQAAILVALTAGAVFVVRRRLAV